MTQPGPLIFISLLPLHPFLSFTFCSLSLPNPFHPPLFPPQIQLWGSAVSSPSGARGRKRILMHRGLKTHFVAASASRRGGLRSATTSNLVIPRCRLSTYGTRAFNVAGTVRWNSLPDYLNRSHLTYLLIVLGSSYKRFYFVNIDTSPRTTLAH